ncbi:MAG: EamA family transporter [bacterium]|jgi:drug/metabolite transporter (DMT)-like permease|nr:EamA family transporter [bacterium]
MHTTQKDLSFSSLATVLLAILFWGSAFTAIAIGLESFGPGELAVCRFGSASLAALGFFAFHHAWPSARDLPRLMIISLFGFTAYHLLLNFGQRVVPPGTASLLVQTVPIWTAILATWMGHETITLRQWGGVTVAILGGIVIVLGGGKDIHFTLSALLILAASFSTAVYLVFGRPLTIRYGAANFTIWSLWIGTLPMLYFLPSAMRQMQTASWHSILAFLFLGLFPTVIAYILWMKVVQTIGASRTSFFLYLSPLVTILTAWLWFGTVPTHTTFLGGAIAIAGVVLINTGKKK